MFAADKVQKLKQLMTEIRRAKYLNYAPRDKTVYQ